MASSPAKKDIDSNRVKAAPFITNQVSLHDGQPQKIDGKTYNFSILQIPNCDHHVATMTILLQVSVPFIIQLLFIQDAGWLLLLQEPYLGDGPYQHLVCLCPASTCATTGGLC